MTRETEAKAQFTEEELRVRCEAIERRRKETMAAWQEAFDRYMETREAAIQAAFDGEEIPDIKAVWDANSHAGKVYSAHERALGRARRMLAEKRA